MITIAWRAQAHAVRGDRAVLDGEIVCLDPDGRSNFHKLLFRLDWPYYLAFDVLMLDGKDLRGQLLTGRKRRLARVMPRVESRVRLVESIPARGADFFRVACERDLEGIVGRCSQGTTRRTAGRQAG